jgi:hypothetical protein
MFIVTKLHISKQIACTLESLPFALTQALKCNSVRALMRGTRTTTNETTVMPDHLFATPPSNTAAGRPAMCKVFTTCMQRFAELDDAAAARGAAHLLLAVQDDCAAGVLHGVIIEVLEAIGSVRTCSGKTASEQAAVGQRDAIILLLQCAVTAGGLLQRTVAAAVATHAGHLGADFEQICPTVLTGGTRSVAALVDLVEPASSSAADDAPDLGQRLLGTCAGVMSSCADPSSRLRAVACCAQLWTCAQSKWAAEFAGSTQYSEHATDLAVAVVNSIVRSVLYDPVGKVRAAATAALLALAPALKPQEVLKLVALKCRDKDKDTRRHAMRVIAAIAPAADAAAGTRTGGSGSLGLGASLGAQLSAAQLQALVLHGMEGAAATESSQVLVRASFWGYVLHHQGRVAKTLAELCVLEQRDLYEPLLREGLIEETFAAAFPEDDELQAWGSEDAIDEEA